MDFDDVVKDVKELTIREQACLIYKLINAVDISVTESAFKYARNRIKRHDNLRNRDRDNYRRWNTLATG